MKNKLIPIFFTICNLWMGRLKKKKKAEDAT